jgi:hypothetical protein
MSDNNFYRPTEVEKSLGRTRVFQSYQDATSRKQLEQPVTFPSQEICPSAHTHTTYILPLATHEYHLKLHTSNINK